MLQRDILIKQHSIKKKFDLWEIDWKHTWVQAECSVLCVSVKKENSSGEKKRLEFVKRDNFDPLRKAVVCSLHFVDWRLTGKHPFPNSSRITTLKREQEGFCLNPFHVRHTRVHFEVGWAMNCF